jgi:hypothetical protein
VRLLKWIVDLQAGHLAEDPLTAVATTETLHLGHGNAWEGSAIRSCCGPVMLLIGEPNAVPWIIRLRVCSGFELEYALI